MDEVARRVELAPAIAELVSKASIHGLESSKALAVSLLRGGRLTVGTAVYRAKSNGELITCQQFDEAGKIHKLWERLRDNHGINITKLRFDPVGEYKNSKNDMQNTKRQRFCLCYVT